MLDGSSGSAHLRVNSRRRCSLTWPSFFFRFLSDSMCGLNPYHHVLLANASTLSVPMILFLKNMLRNWSEMIKSASFESESATFSFSSSGPAEKKQLLQCAHPKFRKVRPAGSQMKPRKESGNKLHLVQLPSVLGRPLGHLAFKDHQYIHGISWDVSRSMSWMSPLPDCKPTWYIHGCWWQPSLCQHFFVLPLWHTVG